MKKLLCAVTALMMTIPAFAQTGTGSATDSSTMGVESSSPSASDVESTDQMEAQEDESVDSGALGTDSPSATDSEMDREMQEDESIGTDEPAAGDTSIDSTDTTSP